MLSHARDQTSQRPTATPADHAAADAWRDFSRYLPFPTAWVDPDERIVWANAAFEKACNIAVCPQSLRNVVQTNQKDVLGKFRTVLTTRQPAVLDRFANLSSVHLIPAANDTALGVIVTTASGARTPTPAIARIDEDQPTTDNLPSARSLLDLLPVGVYVCDAQGRITHFNKKAVELWGRTPALQDADDMYCGSLRLFDIESNELPHNETPMAEVLRTRKPQRDREIMIERPDGSRAVALVNISPLFDGDIFVGAVNCFQDISARKSSEERMRDEIHFREAVESCMPAGITGVDFEGRLIYANRDFCDMVGWTEDELIGHAAPLPYWAPHDYPRIKKALHETMSGRAHETGYELTFRRKSGEPIDVLLRTSPLMADDGTIQGWLASISDISELKRAERTTRFLMNASVEIAQSLDYETILNSVANLMVPAFGDGCVVDVVQPNGDIQHLTVVHSDPDRVELIRQIQRNYPLAKQNGGAAEVIQTGNGIFVTDITDEMLVEAAVDDAHLQWMREMGARSIMILPLNARGRVHGAITMLSAESGRRYMQRDYDIAEELARHCAIAIDKAHLYQDAQRELQERTRAEEALRISEERLRFTLDSAAVGTWDWDMATGRVQWSQNFCVIHDIEPETLSGTIDDFQRDIHPDDYDRVMTALNYAIEGDGTYDVEYRLRREDRTTKWLEAKGRVIYENEEPVAMAGICMDITERRLLEDRFRVAVEASPSAFVMVDIDGRIAMVNTQTERLFGYDRDELLGQPVELLVPDRYRREHPKLRNDFLANPHAHPMGAGRNLYCLRKNGTEFPVEIGLSPVHMPEGDFVLSAIVDITERQHAEDEIRTINKDLLDKNREMEQFVYTVSHDLKSPIVTIMGFLGMLREDLDEGNREDVLDSVQRIERATNRMSELIDDLLELSRIGRVRAEPEPVNFNELVAAIADDLQERIEAAGAQIDIQPGMPNVLVDRKRFVDVFENLLTNALKYGCTNELPRIEIGHVEDTDRTRFFVRDHGYGIDPEYHSRIFGLFQRLDNGKEGTGVGLAIVARVVEVHGGSVWVESSPGNGATFWIALPHDRILA